MKRRLLLIIFSLLITTQLIAGPRWRSFINWVDSADIAGADTSYVRWPKQDMIASINSRMISSTLHVHYHNSSDYGDQSYNGFATTELQTPISLSLAYRGWGLSYTRSFEKYVDDEFSFSTCGRKYGAELRYQHSHSYSGTIENDMDPQQNIDIQPGDITQELYYANVYYVFNSKRFSLPSALLQTVIQRRSAGSWLAAINFQRNILNFQDIPFNKVTSTKISLGGGYAYNWAFAKEQCLLHASFMPLVNVYSHNSVYSVEGKQAATESISLNGNIHLSFVYNVSRYVMGASSIYYLSWQNLSDHIAVVDLNWSSRLFIGVRF